MNLLWRQVMRFFILLLSPVIVVCISLAIVYAVDNLLFLLVLAVSILVLQNLYFVSDNGHYCIFSGMVISSVAD
ncbi:hypothetical protein ACNFJN_15945 [Xenorhabdus budapestensis]|uniref:hypothetical protein n=1 Tax=Xenorhabdus budapestensis TaxID=290110 RepID=UPI003A896E30